MADSKKYNGSTWEHSLRKLATATDTFTTLPADIYANGNNATVGLVGNMSQSGTPSPSSPIQPQETGDMSSNMFDINSFMQGVVPTRCTVDYNNLTNTITINSTGGDASTGNNNSYHIPVISGETYTLSWDTNSDAGVVYIFENGLTDSAHLHVWNSMLKRGTLIARSDTTYFVVRVGCDSPNKTKTYTNIMLNTGDTPLSYQSYGQYKIPISSASTTTPVYLGEVESTRLIRELVLTGEEVFTINASGNNTYFAHNLIKPAIRTQAEICTHLTYATIGASNTDVGFSIIANGTELRIRIPNAASTSLADFKTYLATQYANGTPVTVWYVLANEETAVVNEPIRKIGNYADTVSGITIPTTAGADSFDVLTTLKPSEVTANYHGWHTGAVHERDSGQWD